MVGFRNTGRALAALPVTAVALVLPVAPVVGAAGLGLWMTFKGFNPSAPILAGYHEDAASPSSSAARFPAQAPAVTSAGQA